MDAPTDLLTGNPRIIVMTRIIANHVARLATGRNYSGQTSSVEYTKLSLSLLLPILHTT
jgi:hypothetical protein